MSASLFRLWTATLGRDPRAIAVVDGLNGAAWTRAALGDAANGWAAEFSGKPAPQISVAEDCDGGPQRPTLAPGLPRPRALGAVPAPIDPAEPQEAQQAAALSIGADWLWRPDHFGGFANGRRRRSSGDEALIKMTSGSSGSPKGLPVTHAKMIADGRNICTTMGNIRPGDRNLAVIPLGYSYGLGNLVIPLIADGVQVICASSSLPMR